MFLKFQIRTLPFYFLILMFASCDKSGESPRTTKPQESIKLKTTPIFNSDSAFSFIETQVAFGPRVPNSTAHEACGTYLQKKFRDYGATVTVQDLEEKSYAGEPLKGKNIIASFNETAKKRILLAAHWDTRHVSDQDKNNDVVLQPILGANDGASGVAVLLEIARILSDSSNTLNTGVDIVLFDLEDYGSPETGEGYCLGSQFWSENKHIENYNAYYGILLDMVGGKNTYFVYEDISLKYAKSVLKKVWTLAELMGYSKTFQPKPVPHKILDDHYFMNVKGGIPTIDIIGYNPVNDNFFAETWHTQQDNLANIDKDLLQKVGEVLLQALYQENI